MLLTTQFLLNFMVNFCCGGQSSVERLLQKVIGKESFEIIKKQEKTKKKKTVYFKKYYEPEIVYVNDLLFNLSSNDPLGYFANKDQ